MTEENRFAILGSRNQPSTNPLLALQAIMQERDEERERLRRELQRSQDQIHAFLSTTTSQV